VTDWTSVRYNNTMDHTMHARQKLVRVQIAKVSQSLGADDNA